MPSMQREYDLVKKETLYKLTISDAWLNSVKEPRFEILMWLSEVLK